MSEDLSTFAILFTRKKTKSWAWIDLPTHLAIGHKYHHDGYAGWSTECWRFCDTVVSPDEWMNEGWAAHLIEYQYLKHKEEHDD